MKTLLNALLVLSVGAALFILLVLILGFSAESAHGQVLSEHIVVGLRAGETFELRIDQIPMLTFLSDGVDRYVVGTEAGKHTAVLFTASGEPGEWSSGGCWSTAGVVGPEPDCGLDYVVGFYHAVDDSMVGYVEFRDGMYMTTGGASFGFKPEDVYLRRVCMQDWSPARVESVRTYLGCPVDICVRQMNGEVLCP